MTSTMTSTIQECNKSYLDKKRTREMMTMRDDSDTETDDSLSDAEEPEVDPAMLLKLWEAAEVLKNKFGISDRMVDKAIFLDMAEILFIHMKQKPNAGQILTAVVMYSNRVHEGRFTPAFYSQLMILCNPVKTGKTRAVMSYFVLLQEHNLFKKPALSSERKSKKARTVRSTTMLNSMMTSITRVRPSHTALVLCGSPASALRWQEEATQCGLSSLIAGTTSTSFGDISSVDVVITTCKAWKLLNENTRDMQWESFVYDEPVKNVCTHFRESPYATEHIMVLSDWRALVKTNTASNNYIRTSIAGLYDPRKLDELKNSMLRKIVMRTCTANAAVDDVGVQFIPVRNDAILREVYSQHKAIIATEDWSKVRKAIIPPSAEQVAIEKKRVADKKKKLAEVDEDEKKVPVVVVKPDDEELIHDIVDSLEKSVKMYNATDLVLLKAMTELTSSSADFKKLKRQQKTNASNLAKTQKTLGTILEEVDRFAARTESDMIVGRANAFCAAIDEAITAVGARVLVISTSTCILDEVEQSYDDSTKFIRSDLASVTKKLRLFNQDGDEPVVLLLRLSNIGDIANINDLHLKTSAVVFCGGSVTHDAMIKGSIMRLDRKPDFPLISMRVEPYIEDEEEIEEVDPKKVDTEVDVEVDIKVGDSKVDESKVDDSNESKVDDSNESKVDE